MSRESPLEERYLRYLAKTEEARHMALIATDETARRSWDRLADGWQQLAEHLARLLQHKSR